MSFFDELQATTTLEREHLLHTPIIQDALRGRIDLAQYVAFLTEAYHHVRHTVPLLMACGSRLPRDRAWVRDAVAHYIADETGHDEWILADIAACGADADAVRHGRAGFDTEVMIRFAYHQIDRCNPVGFLGMVHVLEGTSAAIATAASDSIRTSLKLPREAFSYLTSHGSLDIEHTRFFENLVNRLTHPDDRAVTIACARDFYRLYGNVFRSLPSEAKAAA
jgi:pyrroloquinoline quinone (PQQ) biosynthesis protein C